MDLIGDIDFFEWMDFNDREMFNFINPNEVLPLADCTNYENLMPTSLSQSSRKGLSQPSGDKISKSDVKESLQLVVVKKTSSQSSSRKSPQTNSNQTSQDSSKTIRKSNNGKKLTGKERQIELERQEQAELEKKEKNLALIAQLEQKCNYLREILKNIVASSPKYDDQVIDFLDISELLGSPPNDCDTAG